MSTATVVIMTVAVVCFFIMGIIRCIIVAVFMAMGECLLPPFLLLRLDVVTMT